MSEPEDHDLRRLVRMADPLRGHTPALLAVTAAELRGRARLRRRRRWATVAAAATLAVLGAAGVAVQVGLSDPDLPGDARPPDPLRVQYPDGGGGSAGPALAALSTRAAAGADTTTRTGTTTHVTYRTWDPVAGEKPVDARWQPDDADQYAVAVKDPSSRPEVLAAQLDHYMKQSSVTTLIQAVADMNRFHCLTPAQRAAALRVLADTGGVTLRGTATDRQDRPGVAVSMDGPAASSAAGSTDGSAGEVRHLLVFDPDTGVLLSYEQVTQVGPSTSPVRAPALLSYVVYLACEQTAG